MEVGTRGNSGRSTLSQINVTPFVDVMLVLLIIFMVTAPMMETGVEVELPEVKDAPAMTGAQEPLVVTVAADGTISVGKSTVPSPAKLTPVLEQVLRGRKSKEVFLEADRKVPYGRVVQVMAAIKAAGVAKLGMVAEEPER
ncbi:protein TolR [Geothermobacter hydrogeniphilus]|uniref:Protein TolR n=1 Tax=Geothermobacter hydrogeniphilus TaxID=1969733 RepID=A0A2K2HAP4_9BACT|nr:protein TolR [Geothermobacter hydrogeniphilus]PNU20372.1 protein TolR [Geothermobacter hydrogeniphilus]